MNLEDDEALDLVDAQTEDLEPEGDEPEFAEDGDEDGGETVISFGDEAEDEREASPLVNRLRGQLRQALGRLRERDTAANDGDPEPAIPARPSLEAMEYDQDRFDAAVDARDAAVAAHAEWKARQSGRESARQRVADDQAKRIEQQRRALGVSDYEDRSAAVRDQLSDQQMAILINATDNPAKLIYALGRSETRLGELAGLDNLAKFAARVGQLEGELKVSKKKAPAPESRVRGATASTALAGNTDKHLAKLEAEADRTGDRSAVIAYNRQKRQQAA